MKIKKLISFTIIVALVCIISINSFAENCPGAGDYFNNSAKDIMIYEAMSGFNTNNYLMKGQIFTVNWVEYEYYGTQIVSITLQNGTEGFLFGNFSDGSEFADFPKGLFDVHFSLY
jgi:hypothetical protein